MAENNSTLKMPITRLAKIARVTLLSFTDGLRFCDECDDDRWSMSVPYADFKIDFGRGEHTFKCKQHLLEAEKRLEVLNG